MLPARPSDTYKRTSSVKPKVVVTLALVLGACANQIPPIASPTGSYATRSVSAIPISPTSTATLQPTNILHPTSTPANPTSEVSLNNDINPGIPVTGPTNVTVPGSNQPPSSDDGESDKFQNFNIPTGFVIPVTGFPRGMITRERLGAHISADASDLLLVIPSLDLSIPIVGVDLLGATWDISWLWNQAGWLEGTAYPTRNGNSVITAHVTTADGKNGPFAHLKALGIDEYVFIHSSRYRYVYQVISKESVKPDDQSVFSHEVDSLLSLVTCDGYDENTKSYLLRTIVRAKLVDVRR